MTEDNAEIFARLRAIESNQVKLLTLLEERCPARFETLQEHDERIVYLERQEHRRQGKERTVLGFAGVVAAVISAAAAVLSRMFFDGK
jgi:hypothetical protein